MYGLNLVDMLIILALVAYTATHVDEGFLALTRRLAAFIGGAMLAFASYSFVSHLASMYVSTPQGILDALSFILMFFLLQKLISAVLGLLFSFVPEDLQRSSVSKLLAVAPAFIDGLILVTMLLFFLAIVPFLPRVKPFIQESRIASLLIDKATVFESDIDTVFGKAAEESLGFLTVHPEEGESVSLPFKATNLSVDEESEVKMLELVNAERAKVGAGALVMDQKLQVAARKHSTDMFVRSYFAHVDPDSNDPFARMRAEGARFGAAGENLALAHTLVRAHDGLMNSPGHKRNILDPNFKRVGIGVIDGGIYGKMFTQDFSD